MWGKGDGAPGAAGTENGDVAPSSDQTGKGIFPPLLEVFPQHPAACASLPLGNQGWIRRNSGLTLLLLGTFS